MIMNANVYKDRVYACFTGKNIGGTVGFPFEFVRQANVIDGYDESLSFPMPNDDLDLQLLWLIALEEKGCRLDAALLEEYWQRYLTPHWSEYGVSKINMRTGVQAPMSGTVNNGQYKHSNGAWIRSEIWACLCPGMPQWAASMAVEDAILDHGNGEGVWGEVFCAAMQSIAFLQTDAVKLVEQALAFVPRDTGLYRAICDALDCYRSGLSLAEARDRMLTLHRGQYGRSCSPEDLAKGFDSGPIGYDCPLNVAIVALGLLYGEGNFDKMIRSTIYFGEDTDCTVGTAAATFGLMHGTAAIDPKWSAPIGDKITVGTLNLGELGIYGDILPQTVPELTERIYRQHRIFAIQNGRDSAAEGIDTEAIRPQDLAPDSRFLDQIRRRISCQQFRFDFYTVLVDYVSEDCHIDQGVPRTVKITVRSEYKTADVLNFRWLLPEGITVSPVKEGRFFLQLGGFRDGSDAKELTFTFLSERPQMTARCVLELTIDGRTTTMYVPVLFLGGHGEL